MNGHAAARRSAPAETAAKASDGAICSEMMLRAAALRAEQKAPFPEDSADLIREARGQRMDR
jgi:hypothetical protein